jgi:dipeptidyl aminopeptidase/acylaminoacyl peptidase
VRKTRYGKHPSQYGELYLPDGEGPHPVAVVIHGGFWKAVYGRKLMWPICGDLCRRGWAVWNLEYRRLGLRSGGGWPATFDDVAAGIDHLAKLKDGGQSPIFNFDCVVAVGHSAGGHLAAWAAARPDARVPLRAAVSQAGVTDLTYACELRLSRGVVARLLGGTPEEVPDVYAQASPAALIPIGVPLLCVHGELDDVVPPSMSERFAEKARLAGDDVDLMIVEGEDHMDHIDPENQMWHAAREWMDRWR